MNASNSSFPEVVENVGVATLVLAVPRSRETLASIARAALAVKFTALALALLSVRL
jgi:hypothetical protein